MGSLPRAGDNQAPYGEAVPNSRPGGRVVVRTPLVADACDRLGLPVEWLDMNIRLHAGGPFEGVARTVDVVPSVRKLDEPYTKVIAAIDGSPRGSVIVIAARGSEKHANWGELFSCAAKSRHVNGVVVDGLVRDLGLIRDLGFPCAARGSGPLDLAGRCEVVGVDTPVVCGGVSVHPGDWIVGDEDGVIRVRSADRLLVEQAVWDKLNAETSVREDLLAGATLAEVWRRHHVL